MLYGTADKINGRDTMSFLNHLERFGVAIVLWLPITAIATAWHGFAVWFNTWVFSEWAHINWLIVLLVLDVVAGIFKHGKAGTFSARDLLAKTALNKVLVSLVWLALVHAFEASAELDPDTLGEDITRFFSSGVLAMYLAGSIIDSLHAATDGRFPPMYSKIKDRFSRK